MNKRVSKKFTADFETSTPTWYDIDGYARVWAWAISEIGNPDNFMYGNNIDDFMKFCSGRSNYVMLFHNLKFDGQYIIDWLFRNGFSHIKTKEEIIIIAKVHKNVFQINFEVLSLFIETITVEKISGTTKYLPIRTNNSVRNARKSEATALSNGRINEATTPKIMPIIYFIHTFILPLYHILECNSIV